MTPRTSTPPPRASVPARFGPLTVVLAALALVAGLASTGRDGSGAVATGTTSQAGSSNDQLPITWQEAEDAGTTDDVDWGPLCDTTTGRYKQPSTYAAPCAVARPGVAGGATSPGVTADTITVVAYTAADDDLSASLQAKSDPDDLQQATRQQLVELLQSTSEMWGRKVKLVNVKGSGSDETSSRADAVKVAEEIGAFASIGGPGQQSAYAEELASRKVLCIGCGLAMPDSAFQRYAPYLWGNSQPPEQYLLNLGDYVVGRLLGKEAAFGGPDVVDRERVFGVVHFEQDPPVFGGVSEEVDKEGKAVGYEPAVSLTYQLVIPELPEKARVIVARLKEAGVTTVIFLGDPVMPIYLTQAATDQDYFPEWVITGTVLTDTTALGRLYDQSQWAHAFGVSALPARMLDVSKSEAWRLFDWYYGTKPPAQKLAQVILEPLRLFFLGINTAGPNLTPETFRDGLFGYPPTGGTSVAPRISFGDQGLFPNPDYNAVDDMQEIWWDAEATGKDEQGDDTKPGMMRYADGGRRYLPGEMEPGPPHAFIEEGSVLGYEDVPADQAAPTYPRPDHGQQVGGG